MRTIKFRAWDIDKKVMDSGDYTVIYLDRSKENVIYLQFTGLKDKNGKEIYEGDILRNCNDPKWIEIVEWDNDDYRAHFRPFHRIFSNDFEVIGNIYQNQELLHN